MLRILFSRVSTTRKYQGIPRNSPVLRSMRRDQLNHPLNFPGQPCRSRGGGRCWAAPSARLRGEGAARPSRPVSRGGPLSTGPPDDLVSFPADRPLRLPRARRRGASANPESGSARPDGRSCDGGGLRARAPRARRFPAKAASAAGRVRRLRGQGRADRRRQWRRRGRPSGGEGGRGRRVFLDRRAQRDGVRLRGPHRQ